MFRFLVHVEYDLWRVDVLAAAKNPQKVFGCFEWIVEFVLFTFKDHNFESIPLAFESVFVNQITAAVVDVKVTHVVFQKVLKVF